MSQLDILSIDTNIKHAFSEEVYKLSQYQEKLKDLLITVKKDTLSTRARRNLQTNIYEIDEKIESIISGQKLNFYIAETAHLIDRYKKILQTPVKLSFTGKPSRDNKEKNKVVTDYLEIAYKYSDIKIVMHTKPTRVVCNNCPNKKLFDIIDNSIYICISCGSQQEILLHTSYYKDIDRINISAKYTYDRKVHFRDCINQYQGISLYKIFFPLFCIFTIDSTITITLTKTQYKML